MTDTAPARTLVDPTEPAFDEARTPWLVNVDLRPSAVAFPDDADAVAGLVRRARSTGSRLAMMTTGHHAHALGPLDATILVRTERMRSVEVDPQRRVARVGAGAIWADVVTAAQRHGLAPLAGSAADVGVVGYTLGGGMSWLARRYGLNCNNVAAMDVVTADGRRRRIDHDHDPELFWALRGGGEPLAAVTGLEIALFPIEQLLAGVLFWPLARASEVLRAWRDWTVDQPDHVMSCGRLLQFPPLPDIPEPVRGGSFVVVEAVDIGPADEAQERLGPLRALGPVMDTVRPGGPSDLLAMHMDPDGPVPALFDGITLRELPDAAVQALVAVAGDGAGSPLLSVELRHIGGALADDGAGHGALGRIDGSFAEVAVGLTPDAAGSARVRAGMAAVNTALSPWGTGVDYANFSARRGRPACFHDPATVRRLRDVARHYDPAGLFGSSLSQDA